MNLVKTKNIMEIVSELNTEISHMYENHDKKKGRDIYYEESYFSILHLKTLKYLTYDLETLKFILMFSDIKNFK